MNDRRGAVTTLNALLDLRVEQNADLLGYAFLDDNLSEEQSISYGELRRRALNIAAKLRQLTNNDDRIILQTPSGIEFVVAFYGILYANCIAVPLPPILKGKGLAIHLAVLRNANAKIVLTSKRLHRSPSTNELACLLDAHPAPQVLFVEDLMKDRDEPDLIPIPDASRIAVIQYTSGSTSSPKGVCVSHGNLLNNASILAQASGLDSKSVGVCWLPHFHDMGLMGRVIAPLFSGFPVYSFTPALFLSKPLNWLKAISKFGATVSGAPNFAYDLCTARIHPDEFNHLDLSRWEVAYTGAEPVRADTLDRFASRFVECGFQRRSFFPCYGLAEATLIVSGGPKGAGPTTVNFDRQALRRELVAIPSGATSDATERLVAVGHPLQEIRIVDPSLLKSLSPGRVGEIWVKGRGVTQGYWAMRRETTRTFKARTTTPEGNDTYLRTGDLGFVFEEQLFVVGRLKDIVIIRGENHFPQDIEQTAERAHSSLRTNTCAAFSWVADGEEQLAIVVEVRRNYQADATAIITDIRQRLLAEHGIAPSLIKLIREGTALKTTNGKIQRQLTREATERRQLRAVYEWSASSIWNQPGESDSTAPRVASTADAGPESIAVRAISRVMNIAGRNISAKSFLSEYGFDSLKLMELRQTIFDICGVLLSVESVFIARTVAELERLIGLDASATKQIDTPLISRKALTCGPLSYAQERLWLLERIEGLGAAYSIPVALRLEGELDVAALERAFGTLIERHENLRTRFDVVDGGPVQLIEPAGGFVIETEDLSDIKGEEQERAVRRRASEEASRPFDLHRGRLLRIGLLRRSATDHVLLVTMHHIISDAWSMGVLVREVSGLYAAYVRELASPLPALPVQYADYAIWQRGWLQGEVLEKQVSYWKEQLAGAPAALDLPTDRPRPSVQSFKGGKVAFVLSSELTSQLGELARMEGATAFMVLLAAYGIVLSRWSGQRDIVVGSPIAGRTRREVEGLIGFFVNMLPLRTDLSGDPSFRELLARVKETALGAYAHQDLPFEKLVEELRPPRDLSRPPIFQVMINSSTLTKREIDFPGLVTHRLVLDNSTSKYDLSLYFFEGAKQLQMEMTFNSELFEAETISSLSESFTKLLESIVANPKTHISLLNILPVAQVPILSSVKQNVSSAFEHRALRPFPEEKCIHDIFRSQAALTPDDIAVVADGSALTYRQLDEQSERLASRLRELGILEETIVALYLDISTALIVALLAVLKSGAAYLPLDPTHPSGRNTDVLTCSGAQFVVTSQALCESIPRSSAQVICIDLNSQGRDGILSPVRTNVRPSNLAYVIFTSGSTGVPKGVLVEHKHVLNYVEGIVQKLPFKGVRQFAMVQSLTVGSAITVLYPALLFGGCLHLVSQHTKLSAARLLSYFSTHGIDCLKIAPSYLKAILDQEPCDFLPRLVVVAGEPAAAAWMQRLADTHDGLSLYNHYGCTETTIGNLVHPIVAGDTCTHSIAPLGRALTGARVFLLDGNLNLVPRGGIGELYVGGTSVTRGYLDDPRLTGAKFVPDPFSGMPGARLYRTGDLARQDKDGTICFHGRIDNQTKIRGFRVEPGEVECVIASLPSVEQCSVAVANSGDGEASLAAYVVLKKNQSTTAEALSRDLRKLLPSYMVPRKIILIDVIPRTAHGKADRRALSIAHIDEPSLRSDAPQNATERSLVELWENALGTNRVGIHDNFFDLGGHSLLIVKLQSEVSRLWNREVPVVAFFQYPTVRDFAEYLSNQKADTLSSAVARAQLRLERASRRRVSRNPPGLLASKRPGNDS